MASVASRGEVRFLAVASSRNSIRAAAMRNRTSRDGFQRSFTQFTQFCRCGSRFASGRRESGTARVESEPLGFVVRLVGRDQG